MIQSIDKYLDTYGEREIALLAGFPDGHSFRHGIVVPAYNESHEFFDRLQTSKLARDTLLIVIINQSESDKNIAKNHQLFRRLQSAGNIIWRNDNLSLVRSHPTSILLIDHYTKYKIPAKEGVGRARKIGCDIAVKLHQKGIIKDPVLYSTDADAHLPENYFDSQIQLDKNTSALVFDFEHLTDDSVLGRATRAYEQAIKYYKAGLAWAGSPYAFYTLGSILAINMVRYCQVRGFPKRPGGEDFYLLNKLAKVGPIRFVPQIKIHIDARLSDRVPFGTGPAVKKIMDTWQHGEDYLYYHPDNFVQLKNWLDCQPLLAHALFANTSPMTKITDEALLTAAKTMNFREFIDHAGKQSSDVAGYMQQFHNWFDGFRTLKFIHFMQEHYFPAIKLEDCLAHGATAFVKPV